jgi:DNA sulfur modification protein DndC
MNSAPSLFDGIRSTLGDAIKQTVESLKVYAATHEHWAIAYSGGKDSSALVTVVAHLIETGQIPAPKSLTVLYADTRMEITPLQVAAIKVMAELRERGIHTQIVLPELDDRFMVYMFGRGVPPPKNRFRWCTSQIKIEPMMKALQQLRSEVGEKILMLTGVRLGESAQRDARIVMSCSRDGAECGQGWFQEATPEAVADTLAPLLHWRVCHVWAWLTAHAPDLGFPTLPIAIAYGGAEAAEINARTGCMGCPLASKDKALQAVVRQPEWSYLEPLLRLKPLYADLSFNHANRLRKVDAELRKDGSPARNPQRVGPLTLEARLRGLEAVLAIQAEVNASAGRRPQVSLIDDVEEGRIRELIAANTWPRNWDGTEARGDALIDKIYRDGTTQPLLIAELESEANAGFE